MGGTVVATWSLLSIYKMLYKMSYKGGGRRKWRGEEYLKYCREMKIDIWEGVWRRAGEEILPRRGVG